MNIYINTYALSRTHKCFLPHLPLTQPLSLFASPPTTPPSLPCLPGPAPTYTHPTHMSGYTHFSLSLALVRTCSLAFHVSFSLNRLSLFNLSRVCVRPLTLFLNHTLAFSCVLSHTNTCSHTNKNKNKPRPCRDHTLLDQDLSILQKNS